MLIFKLSPMSEIAPTAILGNFLPTNDNFIYFLSYFFDGAKVGIHKINWNSS